LFDVYKSSPSEVLFFCRRYVPSSINREHDCLDDQRNNTNPLLIWTMQEKSTRVSVLNGFVGIINRRNCSAL